MSDLDAMNFLLMNRSVFSTLVLCGVLMPLVVVVVAYLFRNLPSSVRAAAMVNTLIAVVMLTFFTMTAQNGAFMLLSVLSEMAANGSEGATNFMTRAGLPIGQTINPPGWLMGFSLVQVMINVALSVYVFMFAKWDKS